MDRITWAFWVDNTARASSSSPLGLIKLFPVGYLQLRCYVCVGLAGQSIYLHAEGADPSRDVF